MSGKAWTEQATDFFRRHYADMTNAELGRLLGRTITSCQVKARKMGLRKSAAHKQWVTTMERNGNWKGGNRLRMHDGYRQRATGSVVKPEHRLIVEAHLGRQLTKHEVVHHINGDRIDNRIENLAVMSIGDHQRLHKTGKRRAK